LKGNVQLKGKRGGRNNVGGEGGQEELVLTERGRGLGSSGGKAKEGER